MVAGPWRFRHDPAMAVLFVTRAALRRHWRGLVAVALLVGIAGAAVLTAAAGARRTSTALDRFREFSRSADVMLDVGTPPASQIAAMRRFRTVASVGILYQFTLNLPNGVLFPGAAAVDDTFAQRRRPSAAGRRTAVTPDERARDHPRTRRSRSSSISMSATT